jgi:hypothetical protein
MAIIETIPKKSPITDYRNPEGGYHVATCEVCNGIYYPKRSDSKYCCHNCVVAAQRKRIVDKGIKPKRYGKELKKTEPKGMTYEEVMAENGIDVSKELKKSKPKSGTDINAYVKKNKLTKSGTYILKAVNDILNKYGITVKRNDIGIGTYKVYDDSTGSTVIYRKAQTRYVIYY